MLYRPQPLTAPTGSPIDRRTPFRDAAARLLAGETLQVRDAYRTGTGIHQALRTAVGPEPEDHPGRERHRAAWREAAWRLLAPVEGGRVALEGAPEIGFLGELYPERGRCWIPVAEVRDLHASWQRYEQGVPMAVLGHPLHPFYGTYLPTRTTHLELFATWLSQWTGGRERAIDVGTGSGVLALMLARAGFGEVLATDLSPNACESVRRELVRRPASVRVQQADLLEGVDGPADLIVFNPPWTPGPVDGLLDRALHYDDDLFERFFAQARERLSPDGRVVVVFSNVIRLVRPDAPHPIDAAVERGQVEVVQTLERRVKRGTEGRRTRERMQVWELR